MKALMRIAVAATALLAVAGTSVAQVKDHRDIKTPAMRSFNPVQPKRIQLPNGMVIFLQEDRELPLVRGTAIIRGGSRDVPAAKAGLVDIYAQSWRTGGTATRTGDQLDEQLDSRAAMVETSGDDDSTAVTFNVLKGDLNYVFPIFLDVLKNPAFRQEKVDLAKTQLNSVISRRNDEPGDILEREARRLGYGADSPFARQPEYASVASVTREDLLAFHKQTVHPNNIILGVVGDFDSAAMEKRLRTEFASWAKGPQAPAPPTQITAARPGVYFVAKEDVTQANIAFLHGGAVRSNPDYPAIQVMNEILNNGFSGRLMNSLRSKMGLTYGVGGGVGSNWDYPGLFTVETSTKSETTMQTIDALRNELALIRSGDVTEEELRLAKDSILNAYVFTMDSRAKMLNQRMLLEFYGYPADFYQRYPTLISGINAADVKRVANKYVQPDQYAILVVGNDKGFDKPLSTLGTVTPVDITIPQPGAAPGSAAAAPAASASTAEGLALAGKVRDFVGGKAAIDAVQVLRSTGSMVMKTPQGDMTAEVEATVRYPDTQRMVMKLPMGEIITVAAPGGAFMVTPMGTQDMPGSQRDSAVAELKSDTLSVLRNLDNPKYTFTVAGAEKVGDVQAQVLAVNADGSQMKWFVDPSSGRLLQKSSQGRGPAPGEQVTEYREWKATAGINLPSSTVIMRGGEQAASVTVTKIEINPAIDANLFVKPAAK